MGGVLFSRKVEGIYLAVPGSILIKSSNFVRFYCPFIDFLPCNLNNPQNCSHSNRPFSTPSNLRNLIQSVQIDVGQNWPWRIPLRKFNLLPDIFHQSTHPLHLPSSQTPTRPLEDSPSHDHRLMIITITSPQLLRSCISRLRDVFWPKADCTQLF